MVHVSEHTQQLWWLCMVPTDFICLHELHGLAICHHLSLSLSLSLQQHHHHYSLAHRPIPNFPILHAKSAFLCGALKAGRRGWGMRPASLNLFSAGENIIRTCICTSRLYDQFWIFFPRFIASCGCWVMAWSGQVRPW